MSWGKISTSDDGQRFFFNGSQDLLERAIEGVPGAKWTKTGKGIHVMASPHAANAFVQAFAGIDIKFDDAWVAHFEQYQRTYAQAQAIRNETELPPFESNTTPWLHQTQAYHFLKDLPAGALFSDMGCIDGEAMVQVSRRGKSQKMTLAKLHDDFLRTTPKSERREWSLTDPTYIRGIKPNGELGLNLIVATLDNGIKPVIKLTLESGKTLRCTPDHEIITPRGLVHAEQLQPGDTVWTNGKKFVDKDGYVRVYDPTHVRMTTGGLYEHIHVLEEKLGRPLHPWERTHHIDDNKSNNHPDNLEARTDAEHARAHGWHRNFRFHIPKEDVVVSVEPDGEARVFDVACGSEGGKAAWEGHSFIANGICVKNTGKTKVVVDLICNATFKNVLIIGPLKAIEDGLWEREFDKHGSRFVDVHSFDSNMTVKKRAALIREMAAIDNGDVPFIAAINYECLDQEVMRDALLAIPWDLVVLDESHRIKAVTGVRSKFLAKLGREVPRRLILTGTPNADKPIDVWGQFRFLDPTILGNYGNFKQRFCYLRLMPNGAGGYFEKIEGYKNLDQLADEMAAVSFRVTSDVLDLPEQHDVIRYVRLPDKAREIYDRMERDMVANLGWTEEGADVIADNVLTRYLRLQEITSGYLRADEPDAWGTRPVKRFDQSKAESTLEILEDLDEVEPVVIFYRFTEDAEILHALIGEAGTRLTFELSGRRNQLQGWKTFLDEFNDGGVLLVNIAAGAEAIDLTAARYVIYYSPDFSLSHYEQSRKRIHRPGQERPVTYFHIVAEGTVDEYLINALRNKQNIATSISEQILSHHGVNKEATHA